MNKPNIPAKTLEEMTKFFMKTSIPRLIEKERLKNEHNHSRTDAAANR